jgi:predicted AAA+ superfamily ATPase
MIHGLETHATTAKRINTLQLGHVMAKLQDMYKERILTAKLLKLAEAFPVVVVSGARQVGKTTLLRHVFPDYDYTVFDPSIDLENARSEPDLFLRNHPAPAVLDEVQYAPELVSAIKRHVDAGGARPGMYLMSGSQQWQVLRSVAESLAGRAAFLDLRGFSLQELAGAGASPCWLTHWLEDPHAFVDRARQTDTHFTGSLWEWLWRGFLPRVSDLDEELVPEFWMGYHRTYVERDARLMADVEDWQQFGMFLRLVAALTAQEINYSQLGREIGMSPHTARRWLRILDGTFQWFEIPAFAGNLLKRVSSKPKGYLADTGLVCHHAQISSPKALGGHPLLGPLFETAMVNEILKQAGTLPGRTGFHHWRSAGGAEVDLLVERDAVLYPFEMKLTANPSQYDVSGLTAFRRAHRNLQIAPAALLCAVERPRWLTEDTAALPWNTI